MEALRTLIDSLEWEVQHLSVENHKLREENPRTSDQIDGEAELERTRTEAAELADRVKVLERQLVERTSAAEDAESRAEQAETQAAEMEENSEEGTTVTEMNRLRATIGRYDWKDSTAVIRMETSLGC